MRNVLRGANRDEPAVANLEEFRAGMKNLESKVEQLEALITIYKAQSIQ
jgi:hypothetical protein